MANPRFVFGVDLDGVCANLFLELLPMLGAPQALRKLSEADVRIRIITHRLLIKYFHEVATRQTVEWLDRYDIPYWDLCFMQDKTAVGADLYIEDSPQNIRLLRAEQQEVIVFGNSTNEDEDGPRVENWQQVLEMVLERKQAWQTSRR